MSDRPRRQRPTLKRVVPVQRPIRVRVEPLPAATWRLLDCGFHDGATNMAIDEAIAREVADGKSPATLRLYQWRPACLSLGRNQPFDAIDAARWQQHGWDIVRRATGGRAVLHVDELTYSVIAPADEPRVAGTVLESYRRLSAALIKALQLLGVDPQRAQPYYPDSGVSGPACFDGPSDYEITVGQRKLIGSAQARFRGLVLQHGAIPLEGDITRIVDLLALSAGERLALRSRLHYRATTLHLAAGRVIPAAELTAALQRGFQQALNLQFVGGTLSANEQLRATELRAEKYADADWTSGK